VRHDVFVATWLKIVRKKTKTDKTEFSNESQANPRHTHWFCTDCYVRNNLLSRSQAKDDLDYFV
jgi:hypothetical protein